MSSSLISVLLCEIRIDDKQDRRYCLEIVSSKRFVALTVMSYNQIIPAAS